jgi:hypothetical protein
LALMSCIACRSREVFHPLLQSCSSNEKLSNGFVTQSSIALRFRAHGIPALPLKMSKTRVKKSKYHMCPS